MKLNQVFIVHGHEHKIKSEVTSFIEKLGFISILLGGQSNTSQTIIEKIETYTNTGFAIVLYTPDDLGNIKSEANNGNLKLRSGQNLIFEHGYLIAKLSRKRVVPLVSDMEIETPSDIDGLVYIADKNWPIRIANMMKNAGFEIDLNKLI